MRDYASALPVLLDLDLVSAGWNGTKTPYPGIDERTFAMQALRKSLLKKFEDKPNPDANAKALELFLKINSQCAAFDFGARQVNDVQEIVIGEAKDFIYRFFYPRDSEGHCVLSLHSVTDNFGLGNGANIGSFGTDYLSKVGTSKMSATSSTLHVLFMQAISEDPIWSDVESIRSVHRGFDIVQGSRLSFVPKTTEISRTICTEPLCNMLFQKGIGSVLERRLKEAIGIDLSTQPDKNRILAQLGSKTGKFGTIDLSSASDSMSLSLVRGMFPRGVVNLLEMTRSPITTLPGGAKVELHMVSSMGNAFTFPLQTLLFSSLVYGVYKVLGIPFERPFRQSLGNFAVFGDDIIVRREAYDLTCKMLAICGFSVNVDKSFNDGFFRESCGRDYYFGHNVRGVYIRTLKDVIDRYSAINRLNVWSARHEIPLTRLVPYLLEGSRFLPVPFDEMDVSGVKVPFRALRKRKTNKYTGGTAYRYVHVNQISTSVSDIELREPRLRGWIKNPPAVLLAALAGTLRSGKVVTRTSRRSTVIRQRYSSRWDYIAADPDDSPGFGERWKSFVELNLNLL